MADLPKEPPPAPTSDADARATTFQPVKDTGEVQSGEKLLVEAYAAIWAFVFLFVLLSWSRQRAIDKRVDELEAELQRARRDADRREAEIDASVPKASDGELSVATKGGAKKSKEGRPAAAIGSKDGD